ncbi:hypothetical protein Tco_1476730 [Tanacetum coccineum]
MPTKLDELTTNISTLTSRVEKLKGSKLELPTDLLALPVSISNVTTQLQTNLAISAGPTATPPTEGKKATKEPEQIRNKSTITQLFH